MKYDYDVAVIGAGSAGLVAASGCARLGAKVLLVEKDRMGGECLNSGCVPSKTFLKCARLAASIRNSASFGLRAFIIDGDIGGVMNRVKSVIESAAPRDSRKRYEELGVRVVMGEGFLKSPHILLAAGREYRVKKVVIATGSQPLVPKIAGLDKVTFYTNENIFDIADLPKHLIVLGAGPAGVELGQGFRQVGSGVTLVDMAPRLFMKDEPEAAALMEKRFKAEGIKLALSSKITGVSSRPGEIIVTAERNGRREEITGSHLLAALGRVPSSANLGLENAGIAFDKRGYITVDETMRTSAKNIYACGDVTGPYLFTHMASYQAEIIVRNIFLPFKAKVDYSAVPWVTYTLPEVAHAGYTESEAAAKKLFGESVLVDLKETDRALTEGEEEGFLKLILDKRNRVIGVTVVSAKAGEMIAPALLAVKKRLKATEFRSLIFPYPTESEIYKFAASVILSRRLTPAIKKLLGFLLKLSR